MMAARFSEGRVARGISHARLFALHAVARFGWIVFVAVRNAPQQSAGILDCRDPAFNALRIEPRQQSGRIADRYAIRRPRWIGFLPESLAHRLALVGNWFSHFVGLGAVLLVWRGR